MSNKIILPIEIINHILSFRPTTKIAKIIQELHSKRHYELYQTRFYCMKQTFDFNYNFSKLYFDLHLLYIKKRKIKTYEFNGSRYKFLDNKTKHFIFEDSYNYVHYYGNHVDDINEMHFVRLLELIQIHYLGVKKQMLEKERVSIKSKIIKFFKYMLNCIF